MDGDGITDVSPVRFHVCREDVVTELSTERCPAKGCLDPAMKYGRGSVFVLLTKHVSTMRKKPLQLAGSGKCSLCQMFLGLGFLSASLIHCVPKACDQYRIRGPSQEAVGAQVVASCRLPCPNGIRLGMGTYESLEFGCTDL